MGKGGRCGGGTGGQIAAGASRRRSRRARFAARRQGQDRGLPRQAEGLVQIRGLTSVRTGLKKKARPVMPDALLLCLESPFYLVMPGLVPGIHVLPVGKKDVDGRDK